MSENTTAFVVQLLYVEKRQGLTETQGDQSPAEWSRTTTTTIYSNCTTETQLVKVSYPFLWTVPTVEVDAADER